MRSVHSTTDRFLLLWMKEKQWCYPSCQTRNGTPAIDGYCPHPARSHDCQHHHLGAQTNCCIGSVWFRIITNWDFGIAPGCSCILGMDIKTGLADDITGCLQHFICCKLVIIDRLHFISQQICFNMFLCLAFVCYNLSHDGAEILFLADWTLSSQSNFTCNGATLPRFNIG